MNPKDLFIKTPIELLELPGLSPRLLLLYGRLRLHAGKDGKCHPRWKILAGEIGVKNRSTIYRLLRQLRALKLIDWKRFGRHANQYQVLTPDVAFLQRQTLQKCNVSDVAEMQPRKDSSTQKEGLKRGKPLRSEPPRKPPAPRPEPPAEKTKTPGAQKVDDDEPNSKPQASSPEQEFRDRLIERHGSQFDADRCIQNVKRQLEKASGLSMADFVAFDAERTTAPNAIVNGHGYYVNLAKQLRQAWITAAHAGAFNPLQQAAALPEPERDQRGRCVPCKGSGVLAAGGFCCCQLGRDLEAQAGRKEHSQAAKKGPASAGRKGKPNVVNIRSRF